MLGRVLARAVPHARMPRRAMATEAVQKKNSEQAEQKREQAEKNAQVVTPTNFPMNHNIVFRKKGKLWSLICYSPEGKMLTQVHTKEPGLLQRKPEDVHVRTFLMWVLTERVMKAGLYLS